MNLSEFVNKIMLRFPPVLNNGDTMESFISEFTNALQIPGYYNYDEAFLELWRRYSYKTTPTPKIVIEVLKQFEIKPEKTQTKYPEFETIIAEKNGIPYEYGIETTYNDTVKWLKKNGFINIRLKFQTRYSYAES